MATITKNPVLRIFCTWRTTATCLGLFGLALLLRWWGLPAQARQMWGDEATLMIDARNFIQGGFSTPFTADDLGLPAFYDYLLSFPLRLAGSTDVTVARGFSGVLGALSAPLLYLTAVELGYTRRSGVVAGVALATTFWDVHFSRLVLQNIMAASAASVTVLFLVMAVRRSNLIVAALGGAGLAWAFNAYLSGSMVAPVVGVWLGLLLIGYNRWGQGKAPAVLQSGANGAARMGRSGFRSWPLGRRRDPERPDFNSSGAAVPLSVVISVGLTLGLTTLLCVWPLLQVYLMPGNALNSHVSERFILSAANRAAFGALHPDIGTGMLGILWSQLKATAGMFTVRGLLDPSFNYPGRPMLDAVTGPLFILGVASAAWMWRRPAAALALLWLVVPLILGTTLTTGQFLITDIPSNTRSLPAVPAMCLLIAVGLEAVLAILGAVVIWLQGRRGAMDLSRGWPILRRTLVALVLASMVVLGFARYWDYVATAEHSARFHGSSLDWAYFLGPRGAIPVTVVGPFGWAGEFQRLFAPAVTLCMGRWNDAWQGCPPAQLIIFDSDVADAQRYGVLTNRAVHGGPSDDGVIRFWYVEGQPLPDPGHLLGGLH